jgi:hypothetical protein
VVALSTRPRKLASGPFPSFFSVHPGTSPTSNFASFRTTKNVETRAGPLWEIVHGSACMLVVGNLDDVNDFESIFIDIFTRYFGGVRTGRV